MSNVRWARIGFALLAWVFVVLAVFQVYLAGLAIPALSGDLNANFGTHQAMGYVVGIVAIVLLVLSFAGRLSARMIGASGLLVGLMVVQLLLAHMEQASLAALHPVNGMVVILLGVWIAWQGLAIVRAPLPPEPAQAAPTPAPAPGSRPTLDQQDDQEDRI
jgi:hypothetical protein